MGQKEEKDVLASVRLAFSSLNTILDGLPRGWCHPWWASLPILIYSRQSSSSPPTPESTGQPDHATLKPLALVIDYLDPVKVTSKSSHHRSRGGVLRRGGMFELGPERH